uniref:Uncharacterized protein n=1 Tax=Plectus sambesii TaxID=2011161 RepID=A0A914XVY7_9BILA
MVVRQSVTNMSTCNVLLLIVLQIAIINGQYRIPRILHPRLDDNQNVPSVSSSLNAPTEHRQTATLLVKPSEASTILDMWAPYYLTIQRQNIDQRRRPVPFSHPAPRAIQFTDGSAPAPTFTGPDYPRRQAQHEYVQVVQSPGFQPQYLSQVQRQDVQVGTNYPQQLQQQSVQQPTVLLNPQQSPQQFVQLPSGVVYPQQVGQQFIQIPTSKGADYPQQLQQQYIQGSPASGASPGDQSNVPSNIAPSAAATIAYPLRQSFDDEAGANTPQRQFTLPFAPPLLYPVTSALRQSFEEETSTGATAPIVAQNAAIIVPANENVQQAAQPSFVTATEVAESSSAATQSSEASSTDATTTVQALPSDTKLYASPIYVNPRSNGYPLDPVYTPDQKRNLPVSFRTVGAQFDRLISSVNMKELIRSGQDVIDLGAQGLGSFFGLPNPIKVQPTVGFGVLGKKR